MKSGRVFSAKQAAKLLGMDKGVVRRLLQQAKIRGHKTPERWEIPPSEIRRWARVRAAFHGADNFFTPARAARELGISRQAVHQKIRKGSLRSEMIGPRLFIPKSALEEELRNRKHLGLWDVEKVSRALGMTRLQVYRLIKTGSLKAGKIGYYYFVPVSEVQHFKNSKLTGEDA